MSQVLSQLGQGFGVAFAPMNLGFAALGAFFGTVVGLLPGLGPINGVAMLIPIAYAMNLPPETALILLAAVYVGAEYGAVPVGLGVVRGVLGGVLRHRGAGAGTGEMGTGFRAG